MTRPSPIGRSGRATLITADGVAIRGDHRPADDGSRSLVFVVVHGFTGSHDSQAIRRAGDVLVCHGGVVAVSMRGHGLSGGESTLGDREVLDVDAAVRWARRLGYDQVAAVGFSMGASVVLRQAALHGGVDAVVSVSGPSRWYYRGTPAMRRLHAVVGHPVGRLAARWGRRTRITSTPWREPLPMEPREAAAALAPVPLLVAHGDADHYFPLDHAYQLAAGGDHVELWVEYGFEHAENAISDELTERIAGWVEKTLGVTDHGSRDEAGPVSRVEVRYWAAAREAAGADVEAVEGRDLGGGTLAEVLAAVRLRHDERFGRVLGSSSLLVDGVAVGRLDPHEVALSDGATVEVLPPFAGG